MPASGRRCELGRRLESDTTSSWSTTHKQQKLARFEKAASFLTIGNHPSENQSTFEFTAAFPQGSRSMLSLNLLNGFCASAVNQELLPHLPHRCRHPVTWAILHCLPTSLVGSWVRSGAPGTRTGPIWDAGVPKQRFSLLHYRQGQFLGTDLISRG